jgi:exonuclease SbcC
MIINRIRARNVLKYAELSLDLAERGLIAISGPNESGKSSIGETVCFALFGRTFSIRPDEIGKVVRWGENHCQVTLDFAVEDTRYTLSRFLDLDGNHSAKLSLAESADTPIARGVDQVADTLFTLLGFAYEEFIESFYLAQREITTPHPHSQAVRIMAGIAPLQTVQHMLDDEIAERQELLGEIAAEWEAVESDVKGLGIQQGHMVRLEDERHDIDQQRAQAAALAADVETGAANCTRQMETLAQTGRSLGRAGFLRGLALLLALACAGLWLLLTEGAALPQAATADGLLSTYVPQWDKARIPWIGYVAAILGVGFLLLWGRVGALRTRRRQLQGEIGEFGDLLQRARALDPAAALADSDASAESVARPTADEFRALRGHLEQADDVRRMVRDYGEREAAYLYGMATAMEQRLAALDQEIDSEQVRVQEAIDLSEVLNGLSDKREEVEARIDDRRRGLELLRGAVAQLSSNFNRDIKDLVGKMLPLFTDGRYEHLQIDEDLKVRVFSNDKRDFMDLEEVSSGTQRQVMLALRLALSKKLLSRTVRGRQFAFLDEPFAFFDQERTRRALHALADLGDDISQVWIVTQAFPPECEVQFDTQLVCERGADTLSAVT